MARREQEWRPRRGASAFRPRAWIVISALAALACVAWRAWPATQAAWRLASIEQRGDVRFRQGLPAEAERFFREALAARPDRASARNKLAVVLMQQGMLSEAQAALEAGLRAAPATASFHFNMALVRQMQGDCRGALESLETVERLNPSHGDVHFLKGALYERLGDREAAGREFVKELNVDPATPAAWTRLGVGPRGRGTAAPLAGVRP